MITNSGILFVFIYVYVFVHSVNIAGNVSSPKYLPRDIYKDVIQIYKKHQTDIDAVDVLIHFVSKLFLPLIIVKYMKINSRPFILKGFTTVELATENF